MSRRTTVRLINWDNTYGGDGPWDSNSFKPKLLIASGQRPTSLWVRPVRRVGGTQNIY